MSEENHVGWKLLRGVRRDVVRLLKLFASKNSVRYEEFCKNWKEMKFYTIFSCRPIDAERLEFIEEVFQIIKEYLVSIYEFQTRIGALYALYGLYFKQPLSCAKIRFTKTEWLELQSLVHECKKGNHYDAIFAFMQLHMNEAFQFTSTSRATGFEFGFRKYFLKRNIYYNTNYDVQLLYRPLLTENILSTMVQLEELYCKKKVELLGKRNINFINTKFGAHLQYQLKRYASRNVRDQESDIIKTNNDSEASGPSCTGSGETIPDVPNLSRTKIDLEKMNPTPQDIVAVEKGNIEGTELLARKKAEIYIKQMLGEENHNKSNQECFLELPDLEI